MRRGTQALWIVVGMLISSAFIGHLWLRSRIVETGYAIDEAGAERELLREELGLWELERQVHRDPRRIRRFAEREFNMAYPVLEYDLDALLRARRCNVERRP